MEIENRFTERSSHPFADIIDFTIVLDQDVKKTVVGEDKATAAIVVKFESGRFPPVDYYFDNRTALVAKFKKTATHPFTKKEGVMQTNLSEWKLVQGGKMPMRIRGLVDDEPFMDVTITDLQFFDKLDDSEFAKP